MIGEHVIRKRVRVTGRVQGVFFRDSCRKEAQSRGVSGWVRNADDGSVEAVFEGGASAIDELVAWCNRGPRDAKVAAVEVHDEEPEGLHGFHVS